MKIVTASVELIDLIDADEVLKKIERCGRVCYQSETKGKPEEFIHMLIKRGHESVLEHVSLTFRIICDRAIMAELTRHRLASFSVESTRYVKYKELTFVSSAEYFNYDFYRAERAYLDAIDLGIKPEIARSVLPNSLKSELYMTCNLREWRHILKLRTSTKAHPQMRKIATMILEIIRYKLPVIVEDINQAHEYDLRRKETKNVN